MVAHVFAIVHLLQRLLGVHIERHSKCYRFLMLKVLRIKLQALQIIDTRPR